MNIVPAGAADRQRTREILVATARFSDVEIGWAMDLVDLATTGSSEYEMWIARDDGGIAGYVLFGPVPQTEDVFDLYWIAVDPARQGQGIGQMLLRFVENELRRREARMLLIETRSRAGWEPTHRFYRNAGYDEISRIKDFYRIEDDKVVFCKRLTHP
jgi:ribosomal protein S18 acetylase RimI-like enzyme